VTLHARTGPKPERVRMDVDVWRAWAAAIGLPALFAAAPAHTLGQGAAVLAVSTLVVRMTDRTDQQLRTIRPHRRLASAEATVVGTRRERRHMASGTLSMQVRKSADGLY
jgi:hypothetical protein